MQRICQHAAPALHLLLFNGSGSWHIQCAKPAQYYLHCSSCNTCFAPAAVTCSQVVAPKQRLRDLKHAAALSLMPDHKVDANTSDNAATSMDELLDDNKEVEDESASIQSMFGTTQLPGVCLHPIMSTKTVICCLHGLQHQDNTLCQAGVVGWQ